MTLSLRRRSALVLAGVVATAPLSARGCRARRRPGRDIHRHTGHHRIDGVVPVDARPADALGQPRPDGRLRQPPRQDGHVDLEHRPSGSRRRGNGPGHVRSVVRTHFHRDAAALHAGRRRTRRADRDRAGTGRRSVRVRERKCAICRPAAGAVGESRPEPGTDAEAPGVDETHAEASGHRHAQPVAVGFRRRQRRRRGPGRPGGRPGGSRRCAVRRPDQRDTDVTRRQWAAHADRDRFGGRCDRGGHSSDCRPSRHQIIDGLVPDAWYRPTSEMSGWSYPERALSRPGVDRLGRTVKNRYPGWACPPDAALCAAAVRGGDADLLPRRDRGRLAHRR